MSKSLRINSGYQDFFPHFSRKTSFLVPLHYDTHYHYDTHRDESLYLCDHWSFDSQQHNELGLTALLSEMIEAGALVLFGLVSSCPQMIHANGGQSGIR